MRFCVGTLKALCLIIIATGFAASSLPAGEGNSSVVVIDASLPPVPPQPLPFVTGGRSSSGHVLSANNRHLLLDGRPWFPVMGEFHYSRYPADRWEEEILKMKAGGVQIVATYVFWIHHEEIEGQFDWSGQRDLRRFVELCAKHGMYVWIRIGPWAHGECRNGGLPDWLVRSCPTRQNDPAYLRYVQRYYVEIGQQLKRLFWKDGGPIVGVQIENEYGGRGPGRGSDHILELKRLAREAGIDAPFYTVTGWDGVEIPAHDVLPVFGGYVDGFWFRSLTDLPPSPFYFFSKIRCPENVGDNLRSIHPDIDALDAAYPFLTAEMGGGMETSYHRRPLITGDDTGAATLVGLGSGVTLYGYYMFHGGTNPEGKLTTLQESQETGYPNDVPVKSYDYQAPLGEFGQMNPAFQDVKVFTLFLHDFGTALAPMSVYFPQQMPASKSDTSTPRVSARLMDDHGYVFLNNYQRTYPLPERKSLRIHLKLASQVVDIPSHPIDIPTGAYTMWPINLDLDGSMLRYATAQLLCKLEDSNTYAFFAWPGISPEFAFEATGNETIDAPRARVTREKDMVYVDGIEPGTQAAIQIRTRSGKNVQIVVLSREEALNLWKATLDGHERMILSPGGSLFFDGNRVHILASDPAQLTLGVFPKLDRTPVNLSHQGKDGLFERYSASVESISAKAEMTKLSDVGEMDPVRMGQGVPIVPNDSEFEKAARWSIRISHASSKDTRETILRITYVGDIARLYAGGRLVEDNFYDGTPWEIGLSRFSLEELERGIELHILPLRKEAPIYLPAEARPVFPESGQVLELKKVEVIPEYEAVIELAP